MDRPRVAPYGSWPSPISAALAASGESRLEEPRFDGADLYWLQTRPGEGGRVVLLRRSGAGAISELTPPGFSVRSRVHEYGGGAYTVEAGTVYFSNCADQRLYRQGPDGVPQPLTPAGSRRYADLVVDRWRHRLYAVREEHAPGREAVNTLVRIDLSGEDAGTIVVAGNDFYAAPRLSPDGSRLAWLTWCHPNMPWDGCELWVGGLDAGGAVVGAERVAGGPDESIFQPEWSPDGELHFVSDRTGWWNLYRLRAGEVQPLAPAPAEFGRPQWVFGMRTYGFAGPAELVCSYVQPGSWRLARLDSERRQLAPLDVAGVSQIDSLTTAPGRVVLAGGGPAVPTGLVQVSLKGGAISVLHRASPVQFDPAYISQPELVAFPTRGGNTAYGYFYPPRNPDCAAPAGELPPLIVHSHGGPTSAARLHLSPGVQYFTSRGFAVLDADYGGSTGYGRAYRQRLNGNWGVVDVDDCCAGALHLARAGRVDPQRLIIAGGSAGGYTTLCALTMRQVFHCGASRFGISDQQALRRDTHKFESRYCDSLIGPYPERRDLYIARSPLHFADQLRCPVIFTQGLEDPVVPPSQAEHMVAALRRKGLPVAYLSFAGEGHGLRRAENIRRALEAELYFFGRVFGFAPADAIERVAIDNLPGGPGQDGPGGGHTAGSAD